MACRANASWTSNDFIVASDSDRRRWWQKRRWQAAFVLYLVAIACYPLSAGPYAYGCGLGWFERQTFENTYDPIRRLTSRTPLWPMFEGYVMASYGAGRRQAAGP